MVNTKKFYCSQQTSLTEDDSKGLDELCREFNKTRPEMMRELLRITYRKLRAKKKKESLKENAE